MIGSILAEHRYSMVTGRRDSGVCCRLHIRLNIRFARKFTALCILESLLHPIRSWADVKRTGMLQTRGCTWDTLKTRQFFQCDIQFDYAALSFEMRDTFEKALIEFCIGAKLQEGTFGIGIRQNSVCP